MTCRRAHWRWIEHFAIAHQVFKGAHGFVERSAVVGVVEVKDIDAVCLKPLQAGFDRAADVTA